MSVIDSQPGGPGLRSTTFLSKQGLRATLMLLLAAGPSACTQQAPPQAVRIRWAKDAESLDPMANKSSQGREVLGLLHLSLLSLDAHSLKMVPVLAAGLPTVQAQDTLMRVTYTLRPEATWDTGQPVLATDVAYTLKMMYCPGLPNEMMALNYGMVLDVELDPANPRRVTLVCQRATVEELLVGSGDFAVLSEDALDPKKSLRVVPFRLLKRDPKAAERQFPALTAYAARYHAASPERQPGCGPYRLLSWERERALRVQRKASWWGLKLSPRPLSLQAEPAQIDYLIIPEPATAALALQSGSLDLYPMPPAPLYRRLLSGSDSTKLLFRTAASYQMTTAGFNTQRPALRDAATRRALSLLFDSEGLMRNAQQGLGYRSVGLINPTDTAGYNAALPLPAYSPAQALQQLRAAGWQPAPDKRLQRNGTPLALSLTYLAGNPEQELVALQFRAAAQGIGVPVTMRPMEAALEQQELRAGHMDLYLQNLVGSPVSYNLKPILHTEGLAAYNFSRFSNPAMDRLIDAIAQEPRPRQQGQLVRQFQVLMREESPLLVLYFTRNRLVASRRLAKVEAVPVRPGYEASQLVPQAAGKGN